MKIIDLPQGSAEWLAWRKSRLTATDIPIILGSNPFKTKLELWEEKLGLRAPVGLNDAMRRGMMLETPARCLASVELEIAFNPIVCESSEYPWLAASLDGISQLGNHILEIKCTGMEKHIQSVNKCYPIYYYDQMQTQLLCTRAEKCFYMSYHPEYLDKPVVFIEVYPDPEKQAEIIEKGYEFYKQMCNFEAPVEWKLKERK